MKSDAGPALRKAARATASTPDTRARRRGREIKRVLIPLTAAFLLLPLLADSVSAQGGVTVSLSCRTNPETIAVVNNTTAPITVQTIVSLVRPLPGVEPFSRTDQVPAGGSITYQSGSAAPAGASTTLTQQSIFDNDDPTEGVEIITSAGTAVVRCTRGTGVVAAPVATIVAAPSPRPATRVVTATLPTRTAPPRGATPAQAPTKPGSAPAQAPAQAPTQAPGKRISRAPAEAGESDLPAELKGLPPTPRGLPRTGSVPIDALPAVGLTMIGAGVGLRRFRW